MYVPAVAPGHPINAACPVTRRAAPTAAPKWSGNRRTKGLIISVASGKGGTGKTLVATSLALSIDKTAGLRFADMDVEEPNAHLFLHPLVTFCSATNVTGGIFAGIANFHYSLPSVFLE